MADDDLGKYASVAAGPDEANGLDQDDRNGRPPRLTLRATPSSNATSPACAVAQSVLIGALLVLGALTLAVSFNKDTSTQASLRARIASAFNSSAPHQPTTSPYVPFLPTGRLGLTSAVMLHSRNRKKRRRLPPRNSAVVFVSVSPVGYSLSERLSHVLCALPRLGLRCESFANAPQPKLVIKGGGRVVYFTKDAISVRRALRRSAVDARVLLLLHAPVDACLSQWRRAANATRRDLPSVCAELQLESVLPLYRHARHEQKRLAVVKLRDLVKKKAVAMSVWRQVFRFLQLNEKTSELSAIASRVVDQRNFRLRVRATDAPAWAHEQLSRNASYAASLSSLANDLGLSSAVGAPALSRQGLSRRGENLGTAPRADRSVPNSS